MNDLREYIQTNLSITQIPCGEPISDAMVTDKYFGYDLQQSFVDSTFDKNYTMKITLTGRLVLRNNRATNSLKAIDTELDKILTALKGMNFKYSYQDITMEDEIRKILITANAIYNDKNNKIIV